MWHAEQRGSHRPRAGALSTGGRGYRRGVVQDPAKGEQVEVRRSKRRVRTVSAYRRDGTIVVLVPAGMSGAEEGRWVTRMVERIRKREAAPRRGDSDLGARARELSTQYLQGRAAPASVTWSAAQRHRWGSCTPLDGTIRISERARTVPGWVLDYILLHELAHLIEPSHSAAFWNLLTPYRLTERARGWLEGYETGARLSPDDRSGAGAAPGTLD